MAADSRVTLATLFRSRLFWKLYGSFLLFISIAALTLDWSVGRRAAVESRAALDRSLAHQAVLFAESARPWLEGRTAGPVGESIAGLGRRLQGRLTIIDVGGRVLADSQEEPARLDNHAGRPEVQAAREAGRGHAERVSASTGVPTRYCAVRVDGPAGMLGYARVAVEVSSIDAHAAELHWSVFQSALVASLVAVLIALTITRRQVRSLRALSRAAGAIAGGRLDVELPTAERDEIGELAQAFRGMSQELEKRLGTLTADRNKVLAILASMVEGVVAVDREERVVHLNQSAGRMLRVDPLAAVGRRVWEVTRVVEIQEILEAARRETRERQGEVRIADPPHERTIELFSSPLRDASGDSYGAVVVLHDVSELRRLEGVRRDFVANVSHELKTPLTAIRGMVETLLDDDQMPADIHRRFLERIQDQVARQTQLVLDLLTLARIESQEGPFEFRVLDLRAPLRDCAQRTAPVCEQKRLDFTIELSLAPLEVRGDEEGLRQIFGNLLDNAVKYTAPGGQVRLRAGADLERVWVEVQDTGIGIDARDQERIFERFYRVDKARSRELGGTGLGLSIVKHLCLAHQGSVSVRSTLEEGSTFRVELPPVHFTT